MHTEGQRPPRAPRMGQAGPLRIDPVGRRRAHRTGRVPLPPAPPIGSGAAPARRRRRRARLDPPMVLRPRRRRSRRIGRARSDAPGRIDSAGTVGPAFQRRVWNRRRTTERRRHTWPLPLAEGRAFRAAGSMVARPRRPRVATMVRSAGPLPIQENAVEEAPRLPLLRSELPHLVRLDTSGGLLRENANDLDTRRLRPDAVQPRRKTLRLRSLRGVHAEGSVCFASRVVPVRARRDPTVTGRAPAGATRALARRERP